MKQVIVLERGDLEELQSGKTIQLTPQLLLSCEVTRRARRSSRHDSAQAGTSGDSERGPHDSVAAATHTGPITRKELKAAYNRQYHINRKKREASTNPHAVTCGDCGRAFRSLAAIGSHRRHCKGKKATT